MYKIYNKKLKIVMLKINSIVKKYNMDCLQSAVYGGLFNQKMGKKNEQ